MSLSSKLQATLIKTILTCTKIERERNRIETLKTDKKAHTKIYYMTNVAFFSQWRKVAWINGTRTTN